MSLTRVGPENLEVTTLLLQPSQSYTTSSLGSTGSIKLVLKPSSALKGFTRAGVFGSSKYIEDVGVTADDDLLYSASTVVDTNITGILENYLTSVNSSQRELRQTVTFFPTSSFSPGTSGMSPSAVGAPVAVEGVFNIEDTLQHEYFQRKVIRNCLIPDQIVQNPRSNYAYTNYHCLNFMSTSNTPSGSSLIYPSLNDEYKLTGSFTINFFIKPRAQINASDPYPVGSIMHMTSSFCVSLHSASLGADGKVDKFRLMFQTNTATNIQPRDIVLSALPAGVFLTPAVLSRDEWHRVTIRWSPERSDGRGSININGNVTPIDFANLTHGSCKALFVGNYYRSIDDPAKFFNPTESIINGTEQYTLFATDPTPFTFPAPLNAELHQISMFNRYLDDSSINNIASLTSVTSSIGVGPVFYLPVVFTGSAPKEYNNYYSPTLTQRTSTDSPTNYRLALGYNSNFPNIQNFLVEEVRKYLPRAYGFSSTSTAASYDLRTSDTDNVILGASTSNRKRSFTILPCDNGSFSPVFVKSNKDTRFFYDDRKDYDETIISLNNWANERQAFLEAGKFYAAIDYSGTSTYLPLFQNRNAVYGSGATSFSLSPDRSLDAPAIFTIPTPFYGTRIVPGTFTMSDTSVSGSGGLRLTLRDDGIGNLYRCDTHSTPAMWNRVGAIFYDHGLVCILSPHLPYFGRAGFSMDFRGETRKVVASYTVIAGPGEFNLSKNKTYKAFPPTQLISEAADEFVYITGINLHDENLNVIMRAKLAQPIKKRDYDEIAFRLRYDF